MNLVRQARRLKHIRKVKAAIRHQERTRELLAPIRKQNKETKNHILRKLSYETKQSRNERKIARENAEDWKLGPLRPNRAVGPDAAARGGLTTWQIRKPEIPKHWFEAKESVQKRMKTQIPKNVLRDQWPIVEGDRVVVIRGREKNKIGYVSAVLKKSNEVHLKDMNKAWVDGRIFEQVAGADPKDKREWSHAFPYSDIRLVIPYDTYPTINGRVVKMRQDVIVDNVDIERHTRGTDPFTKEYRRKISKGHQVDPATGDVIWHRYIAGTRDRIEWPWETSEQKTEDEKRRKRDNEAKEGENLEGREVEKSKVEKKSIGSFIRTLGGLRKDPKEQDQKESSAPTPNTGNNTGKKLERLDAESVHYARPRDHVPPSYNDDTLRNLVEIPVTDTAHWVPTLATPPMPNTVIAELRDEPFVEYGLSKENTSKDRQVAKQETKEATEGARQKRIDLMKTPMQIRWELEQARKAKYDPSSPPQLPEGLLLALGNHMAANGATLSKERNREAERTVAKINEGRGKKVDELFA